MKQFLLLAFSLFIATNALATNSPEELSKPILESIKDGKIQKLFSMVYPKGSPSRQYFSDSDVIQWDATFESTITAYGKPIKYFEYLKSDIADTFEIRYYLFKFERQPVLVKFEFYKPYNDWGIHSFSIDSDLDAYIEEAFKYRIGAITFEDVRAGIGNTLHEAQERKANGK
jgi:hypothetical protein